MGNRGLTLTEALVLVFIVVVLYLIVSGIGFFRSHEDARKAICRENLRQIGKAMAAYRENYNGYFPFTWGPANGACSTKPGSTDVCDAATSLGCLYPDYLNTAKIFRCPSTEDQPSFVVNTPQGVFSPAAQPYLWSQHNWTLTGKVYDMGEVKGSSYGYDPRIYPRAIRNMTIMADWDGSWQVNNDTATQNHDGGQNVLFVDGSVKWQTTNYCSNDPIDNIFIEGGIAKDGSRVYWNADTDSFLVNGAATLTLSYNEYPTLQK